MNRARSEPPPTVASVRRFWDAHVNNEYYTSAERGTPAYFAEIERKRYRWHYHLSELFQGLKGSSGRLLDVGCGIGVDSIQLAGAGFDVTAVDLTESAVNVAREFASQRKLDIDFATGNAEALDFPDGTFDVVYSFGALHHTPDVRGAIEEVHRVLRPGGLALVMLYHRWSLVNAVHRIFRLPYESPRGLRDHCPVVFTFSAGEVKDLFDDFDRVEVRSEYPFTYGFRRLVGWVPLPLRRRFGRWVGWHLMVRAVK